MNKDILNRYISFFRYSASLPESLDSIQMEYAGKRKVLDCVCVWEKDGEKPVTMTDFQTRTVEWGIKDDNYSSQMILHLKEGPEALPEAQIFFYLCREGITLKASVKNGYTPVFQGTLYWGKDPEHSTFAVSLERPGFGLRAACGPATSLWDDALLDRQDGSLLRLENARLQWSWEQGLYTFTVKNSVHLQISPRYFEDRFQVPYKPLHKKQYPTPPAGWMTWYAVKFDACEEAVLENTRLQKTLLGEYGADTVWVDWEWYHAGFREEVKPDVHFFRPDPEKYPHGMAYVAEKIKEAGFIPALWIAPTHEPAEGDFIRENPDTVLLDTCIWCGRFIYDITHPKFLEEYLPKAIAQVPKWGYEALKWDVLPYTLVFADKIHQKLYDPECSTYEAYRRCMQMARDIVGEDFYMLSCSGNNDRYVLTAGDVFDGSRIGGDIFTWEEFKSSLVERVLRVYPYHNTLLYCDPDNLVLRPEFNDLHQARTRAAIVSLLGLPATFGDDLRELPEDRVELLRRSLPTLDVHPMDMRELGLEKDEVIINLVIDRPFEKWNVAGVLNLNEEEKEITVDLEKDLGLENGEYLVYEYWTDTFYGVVRGSLTVKLPACGCGVLAVRKKTGKLQLVTTSRHLTQGAAELLDVKLEKGKLLGRSKVVKGDAYCVKAYDPETGKLLEKTFLPEMTGELAWALES